jgi:intein/homing endonuclease
LVLSFNHDNNKVEFNKILDHSILRNNNDWYKIYLTDGSSIILTSNHKIYLPEINAYREVKDLKEHDKILKILWDI